jgi:hypothetical protein
MWAKPTRRLAMNRGSIESNQIKIFLQPAKLRERNGGGFCVSKTVKDGIETYKLHYLSNSTEVIPNLAWQVSMFESTEGLDRTTFDSLKGQAKRNFLAAKPDWSDHDNYEISILGLK